ncbi:MAG: ABC transporter permease [Betaproteobacteria bacterium]|nr:ABC transporter permease [Betaproteobacteria bacterium]
MHAQIYSVAGPLGVFALWELVVRAFGVPVYVLPAPSAIGMKVFADSALMLDGLAVTLMEAVVGYVIGSTLALAIAIGFILWRRFERVGLPALVALNSVPVVAFAPVALLWFGSGPTSKIALVTLAVGFAVFVNAHQGLRSVDESAANLLRSFGAGPLRQMAMLRIPAALPSIMNGLRIAVVRSMIVAIVAEMLAAFKGLGATIFESTQQIDFLRAWAAIAVASAASMVWYGIVNWIDQRYVFWK